jgi:hypothetical protein
MRGSTAGIGGAGGILVGPGAGDAVCFNSEGAQFKLSLSGDLDLVVHFSHYTHLGVWPAQALSRIPLHRKSPL